MPYFIGVSHYPPFLSPWTSLMAPMMLLFVSWKKKTRDINQSDAGIVKVPEMETTPKRKVVRVIAPLLKFPRSPCDFVYFAYPRTRNPTMKTKMILSRGSNKVRSKPRIA